MSRIHVTGAAGSGATTLGRRLAEALGLRHCDADDYYWEETDPPFRRARPAAMRQRLLRVDLDPAVGWVLSGSVDSWSEPFESFFDLIVFLDVSTDIRVQRLRRRETDLFGPRLLPGGDMYQSHSKFLSWAEQYEAGIMPGRSRARHERWLRRQTCPVLRLEGDLPPAEALARVLTELRQP